MDTHFKAVINACAQVRLQNSEGTWIGKDMIRAYTRLHESGYAHSVEAWYDGELVGGLYGVSMGKCFFGESMFTRVSNASKVAMVKLAEYLVEKSFKMIDCQVTTDHLIRMGAREIPRIDFMTMLKNALAYPTHKGKWTLN
jgi:leucyl/phenylalanyl-tRNA--protein transferase